MKMLYLISVFVFISASSFGFSLFGVTYNSAKYIGNSISGNNKDHFDCLENEYMFILLLDGCYHLYRLESYIDNTGMSQQQWVYVDPMTYSGTHTICMNPSDFEYLC